MDYDFSADGLNVRLGRDFNLMAVRRLERLAEQVDVIRVDCARSRLVDSEAIMLLYRLIKAGKTVRLTNTPPILEEALQVLELETFFKEAGVVE